jgi:hypothetical protein
MRPFVGRAIGLQLALVTYVTNILSGCNTVETRNSEEGKEDEIFKTMPLSSQRMPLPSNGPKLCVHFNKPKGCFRGAHCKFLHIRDGAGQRAEDSQPNELIQPEWVSKDLEKVPPLVLTKPKPKLSKDQGSVRQPSQSIND